MTDRWLTDELVLRVLGWRSAPDRYIKPGRSWIPRSKFRPLIDLRDAFRVLDALTDDYAVRAVRGNFSAELYHEGRVGRATARHKARAIVLAVAQALGIEVETRQ
jgi:hypothetical protein